MSAMALLRTQPTAAITFGAQLFHFASACPQHNISTSTRPQAREPATPSPGPRDRTEPQPD
eukprot:1123029-Prymnesium_polylepis.1